MLVCFCRGNRAKIHHSRESQQDKGDTIDSFQTADLAAQLCFLLTFVTVGAQSFSVYFLHKKKHPDFKKVIRFEETQTINTLKTVCTIKQGFMVT